MVRRTTLVAVVALVASGAMLTPSSATVNRADRPSPPSAVKGFRTVQANLRSPNVREKFLSDMNVLRDLKPDFATLNEVGRRSAADLTLPGYGMFTTPGYYTGANAVIWRTSRWTMTDSGIVQINNKRQIPKGRHTMIGLRYANWVTLKSNDGRVVSVVAAHFVPMIKQWPSQIPNEVRNLGNLVNSLATAGPVFVGGDLNMGYGGRYYPRAEFDQLNLVASFDLLHASVPTGDHLGATIDYTLVRQDHDEFTPTGQFTEELKSDHDALVTDWRFNTGVTPQPTGVTFARGIVHNRPHGSKDARLAVVRIVRKAIVNAPPGSAIHLKTGALRNPSIIKALTRADHRGVKVQVVQASRKRTTRVTALRRQLGAIPPDGPWFTSCRTKKCRNVSRKMAPTVLLVSRSGLTSAVRIRATRALTSKAIHRRAEAKVSNGLGGYNRGFHRFFALVGGY